MKWNQDRNLWGGVGRLLIVLAVMRPAEAAPVSSATAHHTAEAWLARVPRPLGCSVPYKVGAGAWPLLDDRGDTVAYVIRLQPQGFLVTSADTEVEPIIAFSGTGQFSPQPMNPLQDVLRRDLRNRAGLGVGRIQGQGASPSRAAAKWSRLSGRAAALQSPGGEDAGRLDDLRVASFLQSRWNQGTIWNGAANVACYNYYTPPYGPGASSNYVAGCNATAWGQILRYFEYPTQGVGASSFQINVDGAMSSRPLRGGDGQGGPYNWSRMPAVPGPGTTEAERQAVGALLADLGVANHTSYSADESVAGPSAAMLTNLFHFSNVVADGGLTERFAAEINANLDAQRPVWLSLWGQDNQHAVVCDGYGFNFGSAYYHLNMGWSGMYDAWYNLPTIGTPYGFNVVGGYFYNLYTNGTGEIISGRVTSTNRMAVANALVHLVGSGLDQTTVSDERGIYAFAQLPSDTAFILTAAKPGYGFWPQRAATSHSQDHSQVGNLWGVDFAALNGRAVWGTVRRVDGLGCAGVLVQFSNGGGTVTTDGTGYFQNTVPVGWSGTMTAVLAGFDVVPPARGWTNLTSDLASQDFVIQAVVISGATLRADGVGLGGVLVQFSNGEGQVMTDSGGFFTNLVPLGWSGTITPSRSPYQFVPAQQAVTNLALDLPNVTFAAGRLERILVDARATGWNDGASWADACPKLATALSQAQPGTEVWVAGGTYFPGTQRFDSIRCPPGVRIYGGFIGGETNREQRDWRVHPTILSGRGCYHVVTGAKGAQLDGFTITGGNAIGFPQDEVGGGVWADDAVTNFLVCNGTVVSNTAAYGGGGCYNVTLVSSVVASNAAEYGGGVANCSLTNCQLLGNAANSGEGGGADSSRLTLCLLSGNAAGDGGAVSRCTLTNCVLRANVANGWGGGAYASILAGCLVNSNVSSHYGGGAFTCSNINCTIVGNRADWGAGGLSGGWALNSIVYLNSGGGSPDNFYQSHFSYSCTYPDPGGDHNLTNNPSFVSVAQGDYRLAVGSPCLDRGTNQPWMDGATDLAGHPRLLNGTVDVGAYEGAVPVLQPSLVWSGGQVHIRLRTLTGATYTLEATDVLSDPTWRTLTQRPGNGSVLDLPDPTAITSQRFYRARQE